ncbi:MAG: HAD family hydrolase [Solirubrobacteraceae bacterium]
MTAAILDVDGTLVDTNYQHALAWYMALREHDVGVPVWQVHRRLGMGGDQLVAAVAGGDVEERCGDAVRTAHDALYLASIQTVSPFAGARQLIQTLHEDGHAVVLASSAKARELDHYLDVLDARHLVDGWTTAADVERTKPHPDLILAALDKLEGPDAVMIGDSPWDIEAARGAGVPTIAVLTGGFSEAELIEAGAACVFESVAALRAAVGETPLLAS